MSHQVLSRRPRRGTAAVEFAFVMPILVLFLLGIWEVGRLVEIQQVLANAAREGGRFAATASYIDNTNTQVDIYAHPNPNGRDVETRVVTYLQGLGLDTTSNGGVTVNYQNLTNPGLPDPYQAAPNDTSPNTRDQMRVTVSLPFRNVKWILLPSVVGNTSTLTATSDWTCAKDVPFTINTNIPK